jgi:hypothetical protein
MVPTASRGLASLGMAAMAMALLELFLFGVIGWKRNPEGFADTVYFHAAGRTLLDGANPYDPPTLRAHAGGALDRRVARLYYPPQSAPFFMLLGLFGFGGAKTLLMAINIAATGGVCFLALRSLVPSPSVAQRSVPWLLPAMILGDPWLVDAVWWGGVAPLVTFLLMGGWTLAERGRPILGGVLFGLATLKPQFALLPLIWMVCERRRNILASAAATVALCMAVPLVLIGPRDVVGGWLGNLRLHPLEFCNALGFPHLMGLPNLLYAFGVTFPHPEILAILLTVALWTVRRRLRPEDVPGILAAMSVTLLVAHDYDMVVLVPLFAALWRHLAGRPRAAAVALGLAAILMVPGPLLAKVPVPWLAQRSTVTVLLLLFWIIRLSTLEPKQAPDAGPALRVIATEVP